MKKAFLWKDGLCLSYSLLWEDSLLLWRNELTLRVMKLTFLSVYIALLSGMEGEEGEGKPLSHSNSLPIANLCLGRILCLYFI